jgi:flavodoxin
MSVDLIFTNENENNEMSIEMKDEKKIDLSRRNLLKGTVAALIAGIAAPAFPLLTLTHAAATANGKPKVLIIYYSRTGNTREIANQIHKSVVGDIFEIHTTKRYPDDYEELKKVAQEELATEYKPALKTTIENIRAYDVVFIGYPIWWGTFPAPVRTFLSEYDLSKKTVVPFCTHLGSRLGRSVRDISNLCLKSTIQDGLAVWGRDAKDAQKEVSGWLHRLGMIE